MKIRMLEDAKGSENGTVTKVFKAGEVYDIEESLGKVFVDEMRVAMPETALIPVTFETPEKGVSFETPERVTLNAKPKRWIGLQIRPLTGGEIVEIRELRRGGKVLLSDGQLIHFALIRNEWEIADGD